jgi:voltage-gated potassium channel Kch
MVKAELRPFRGLLLGLFFITVGMSLELPVVFAQAPLLILLVVGLTVVKTVGLAVPARLTRFPTSCSVRLGLLLSQGSEFAFVLFALMAAQGLLAGSLASLLIAAVAISIACTPALTVAGRRIARWLERPDERAAAADRQGPAARGRMLISGLDEAARTVARALDAVDIAYLALEDDAERFAQARGDGFNVSFGSATRLDLLDAAGAGTARAIVVAPDDSAEVDSLMAALRSRYPGVPLLARASNPEHAERLRGSGATVAADDDGPSGAALATEALRLLGVAEERIDAWLAEQSRAAERDLKPGEAVPRPT